MARLSIVDELSLDQFIDLLGLHLEAIKLARGSTMKTATSITLQRAHTYLITGNHQAGYVPPDFTYEQLIKLIGPLEALIFLRCRHILLTAILERNENEH